jgi:hypothetical protein
MDKKNIPRSRSTSLANRPSSVGTALSSGIAASAQNADGRTHIPKGESKPKKESGRSVKGAANQSALSSVLRGKQDVVSPDDNVSWSQYAPLVCCLNSYPNGVTFSIHNNAEALPLAEDNAQGSAASSSATASREEKRSGAQAWTGDQFFLRLRETREYRSPRGKYFLYKDGYQSALERHLSRLHKKGLLKTAVFYFGTTADPFMSFHKRFDVTTACLQLLERYRPGRLIIQTRSPMAIAALPTLRLLGDEATIVVPIETHLERAIARYTPGQPKIAERLVMVQGLRRQGIVVNLCAAPILPYGDHNRDCWDFAELLDRYSDYITVGSLAHGTPASEKQLKDLPIARKLSADEQFLWLRPNAHQPLYQALSVVAPEKLKLPVSPPSAPSQMTLFAA